MALASPHQGGVFVCRSTTGAETEGPQPLKHILCSYTGKEWKNFSTDIHSALVTNILT